MIVIGNRAVITTCNAGNIAKSNEIGVYLHWNGGRDSIEAFLLYCELKGYRPPSQDSYGWARLCQVIGNFFGGELSVGIDRCCNLDCDNWDNGVYIIDGWKIVGREYFKGAEQSDHDLLGMLVDINDAQPESEQVDIAYLGEAARKAKEV